MSELMKKLMDRAGITKVPRYAQSALGYKSRVQSTNEFKRIENLPRRKWTSIVLHQLVGLLTQELKTESGSMELWQIQACALNDIILYKGAFLPIGVGQGKALISLLAPVVLDSERPLLIVPAQLREQTNEFVIPEMRKHWKFNDRLRVIGSSELSLAKNANLLEEYNPDLIVIDEVHEFKNPKAGRTRRMHRFMKANPETPCVTMSGTISTRSLKDWAHIAQWSLRERTPVPLHWTELSQWADCLDAKVDEDKRVDPGVLETFCEEGENVRQGFQRRLVETPGVVGSKESDLGVSLRIFKKEIEVPRKIKEMILHMRSTWTTPDGDIVTEAVDLWRHIRELSLGFWYKWDPAPPRDWLDARRAWKSYVRETLKHNRRGLDTELQVWNEMQSTFGDTPGYIFKAEDNERFAAWKNWKDIKDTFKPNTVAIWESSLALNACFDWLYENNESIVWTEHRAFGEELEKFCEQTEPDDPVPYFGAGDSRILDTKATRIIASIGAHSQGKNLQRFSRNLVVAPPTSGKAWEQMLARTHRPGQEADEVVCDVFLHFDELREGFEQARQDARYLEDTYGNRQKLNYADIVIGNSK